MKDLRKLLTPLVSESFTEVAAQGPHSLMQRMGGVVHGHGQFSQGSSLTYHLNGVRVAATDWARSLNQYVEPLLVPLRAPTSPTDSFTGNHRRHHSLITYPVKRVRIVSPVQLVVWLSMCTYTKTHHMNVVERSISQSTSTLKNAIRRLHNTQINSNLCEGD